MRALITVVASLLLIALLASCAPQAAPLPAPAPAPAAPVASAPSAPVTKAPSRQAWEEEWDRVVEAARKEGGLLVYSFSGEYRTPWSAAMEKFGIRLETIAGRGAEIAPKILSERRAGIYASDLYTGGTTTPLNSFKSRGALDPMDATLVLPEVTSPKNWFREKLPYVDDDHTLFTYTLFTYPALGINTNLVKPGEIKSYNDLLDPKWREKIVILDPTAAGTGESFVGVIGSQVMGWDFIRKLAENKLQILKDERQRVEWLAHGKVAIAIAPQSVELAAFRNLGAPIAAVIPQEGGWLTAGTGSLAVFNRAPHPNATKVFSNWLLSKEGQTIYSKLSGSQSARVDVPTDFLDPVLVRDPAKKYFVKDTEEYLVTKQAENAKIIKEIFKDLK